MGAYSARFQSQRNDNDPYSRVNCAAYSMAMAIDKATHGGLPITGKTVRELTDEPVPEAGSPGLTLRQILAVARRLRVPMQDRTGDPWSELRQSLAAFRGVLLAVDYGNVPPAYRSSATFTGNHMLYLERLSSSNTVKLFDPLAKGHRWIPLNALQEAALVYGGYLHAGGPVWARTRPDPAACLA